LLACWNSARSGSLRHNRSSRVNYSSASFSESYDPSTGLLTVTDGSNSAKLVFENFNATFDFASDGHGGTLVFDPPSTNNATPSVSIGGAGNDTFIFHPGEGAQTVTNFHPQSDTIELDHFTSIQNVQELAAAITPDAHGNAVIELGRGDSVAIPGASTSFLLQHLQSMVHLH
jgi:hypothetical protein